MQIRLSCLKSLVAYCDHVQWLEFRRLVALSTFSLLVCSSLWGTTIMAESLQEKLDTKRNAGISQMPTETREIMGEAKAALTASGITEHAPRVGSTLPDGKFVSALGEKTSLTVAREKKTAIITFYRGGWCPYCNLQLHEYQQHLKEVQALGAQLIAITPELPDNALSTKSKNELEFIVLSDPNNTYARSLGIVYELPESLRHVYEGFGIDLPKANGSRSWELPLAATFVVNAAGIVQFAFVDADYTKRAEPEELLKALRAIK